MRASTAWTFFILLLGVPLRGAIAQSADADSQARDIAVKVCSACHGPGGDSGNPMFPKLAAQQSAYLEEQLKLFRSRERAEPDAQHFMWGAASRDLDERMVSAVARYYASQPAPKAAPADAALAAKGRQLYQQGAPERQIPACATCHGAEAKGIASFPRLAGQHAAYLVKQIQLIRTAVRKAPVMHGIIQNLKDEDATSLAAYLQSLN